MVSEKLHTLGGILAVIGFVGTILICGLPAWKMSAFIGANIVTFQVFWEGLWMDCVVETTGQMQCKVYDSLLILPTHLQAARALVIVAIIVGLFGIVITSVSGTCINFITNKSAKAKVAIIGGIAFILAGFLVFIPVFWTTSSIVRDFYNPAIPDAKKRELGPCLYVGWACAALFFIGGGLLCSSCPPKFDAAYPVKYTPARSAASTKSYV